MRTNNSTVLAMLLSFNTTRLFQRVKTFYSPNRHTITKKKHLAQFIYLTYLRMRSLPILCAHISERQTGYTKAVNWQAHSQDFTLGGGTEAARVHFIFSKKVDDFFWSSPSKLELPSSGIHICGIFEAHRTLFDWENSVTLLNKAGHTSEQRRFFGKKIHTIDDWGAEPPWPTSGPHWLCPW